MATLMEKDVLIEVVAGALAIISKRLTIDEKEQNPDRTKLIELRSNIYSSTPEQLDYQAIIDEVGSIKSKYENLPKLPQFQ